MNNRINNFTRTAILLGIAVSSQLLKNFSVLITGSVVNCILLICLLYCGLKNAALLCAILPMTSWIITASPVMSAMPLIVVCIILGNFAFVISVWLFERNNETDREFLIGAAAGSAAKSLLLLLTVSYGILSVTGPKTALPEAAIASAKVTFSFTQFITAAVGSALAYVIKRALDKRRPE